MAPKTVQDFIREGAKNRRSSSASGARNAGSSLDDLFGAQRRDPSTVAGARQAADDSLSRLLASAAPQSSKNEARGIVERSGAGLLGALGDIFEVIDTPRRFVVSTIKETGDLLSGEGFSGSDWLRQVDDGINMSDILPDTGIGWLDGAIGFVGDVALDPLTYLAPGSRLVATGARVGAKQVARKFATEGVEKFGKEAAEELAQRVTQRGIWSVPREQLAEIGIERGMYWTVPGTGRYGRAAQRALGVKTPAERAVRVSSGATTGAVANKFAALRQTSRNTAFHKAVTEAISGEMGKLRTIINTSDSATKVVVAQRVLDFAQRARGVASEIRRQFQVDLRNLNKAARSVGLDGVTLGQAVREGVDGPLWQQLSDAQRAIVVQANEMTARWRATLNAEFGDEWLRETDDYMFRTLSEEARKKGIVKSRRSKYGSDFPLARMENARLYPGDTFLGKELVEGIPVENQIEAIAKEVFGGEYVQLLEDDFFKAMNSYTSGVTRRFREKLLDRDLVNARVATVAGAVNDVPILPNGMINPNHPMYLFFDELQALMDEVGGSTWTHGTSQAAADAARQYNLDEQAGIADRLGETTVRNIEQSLALRETPAIELMTGDLALQGIGETRTAVSELTNQAKSVAAATRQAVKVGDMEVLDSAIAGFETATEAAIREIRQSDEVVRQQIRALDERIAGSNVLTVDEAGVELGRTFDEATAELQPLQARRAEIERMLDTADPYKVDPPTREALAGERAAIREQAGRLAVELRGQMDALRLDESLALPPPRQRRVNSLSQVSWTRQGSGEWDWLERLSEREIRRLRESGRLREGGLSPDQLTAMHQAVNPEAQLDDAMELWLEYTRQIEFLERFAQTGKIPQGLGAYSGRLNIDALLASSDTYAPDFRATELFGKQDAALRHMYEAQLDLKSRLRTMSDDEISALTDEARLLDEQIGGIQARMGDAEQAIDARMGQVGPVSIDRVQVDELRAQKQRLEDLLRQSEEAVRDAKGRVKAAKRIRSEVDPLVSVLGQVFRNTDEVRRLRSATEFGQRQVTQARRAIDRLEGEIRANADRMAAIDRELAGDGLDAGRRSQLSNEKRDLVVDSRVAAERVADARDVIQAAETEAEKAARRIEQLHGQSAKLRERIPAAQKTLERRAANLEKALDVQPRLAKVRDQIGALRAEVRDASRRDAQAVRRTERVLTSTEKQRRALQARVVTPKMRRRLEREAAHRTRAEMLFQMAERYGEGVEGLRETLRLQAQAQVAMADLYAREFEPMKIDGFSDLLRTHSEDILFMFQKGLKQYNPGTQAEDWVVDALSVAARMSTPEDVGLMAKYFDKVTGWWKTQALLSPGYHVRNFLGGIWNNYLAGVDVAAHTRFWRARSEFNKLVRSNGGDFQRTLQQALQRSDDVGKVAEMFRVGVFANVGRGMDELPITTLGRGLGRVTDPIVTAQQFGSDQVESMLRGALALDVMSKGGTADDAYEAVIKYHFDYTDLSATERKIRRAIPFWSFTRRNFPLQIEALFKQPGKVNNYLAFKDNMERQMDAEGIVPLWFSENMAVRMPFTIDGQGIYVMPDLPLKDLRMLDWIGQAAQGDFGGAIANVASMANPMLKTPMELSLDRQFFNKIPLRQDYVEAPSYLTVIPGMKQALEKLGVLQKHADGGYYGRQEHFFLIDQMLPVAARVRRLLPSEEKYEDRWATSTLAFLFGPFPRTNTETEQKNELYRRSREVERIIADVESLGIDVEGGSRVTFR